MAPFVFREYPGHRSTQKFDFGLKKILDQFFINLATFISKNTLHLSSRHGPNEKSKMRNFPAQPLAEFDEQPSLIHRLKFFSMLRDLI